MRLSPCAGWLLRVEPESGSAEALVVLLQLPSRVRRACAPGGRAFDAVCSQGAAVAVVSCL